MKKSSAETEPAWNGAGQKVGIQIWRIVKFKVCVRYSERAATYDSVAVDFSR